METATGTTKATSRKAMLQRGSALAAAAALFGVAGPAEAAATVTGDLTVDVAVDGRTQRFNRADPALSNQFPVRGDTFVLDGKLYPGGTYERGLTGPDQPGSIGTWTCLAVVYNDFSTPKLPKVAVTQFFKFVNGDFVSVQGFLGAPQARLCIVGGLGAYLGARGYTVELRMKKDNDTWSDYGAMKVPSANLRYVFTLAH